jgi:hypothetical protein
LKDKQEHPTRVCHLGKDKRSRDTTSLGDRLFVLALPQIASSFGMPTDVLLDRASQRAHEQTVAVAANGQADLTTSWH